MLGHVCEEACGANISPNGGKGGWGWVGWVGGEMGLL
jgi:hypothetical protein